MTVFHNEDMMKNEITNRGQQRPKGPRKKAHKPYCLKQNGIDDGLPCHGISHLKEGLGDVQVWRTQTAQY